MSGTHIEIALAYGLIPLFVLGLAALLFFAMRPQSGWFAQTSTTEHGQSTPGNLASYALIVAIFTFFIATLFFFHEGEKR